MLSGLHFNSPIPHLVSVPGDPFHYLMLPTLTLNFPIAASTSSPPVFGPFFVCLFKPEYPEHFPLKIDRTALLEMGLGSRAWTTSLSPCSPVRTLHEPLGQAGALNYLVLLLPG